MTEIVLPGAPIDLDVNKAGDLIYLSESKAFVISLSRNKDSAMLSNVTLPVLEIYPYSTKTDLPFIIAKRIWWVPSMPNYDSILLLTTSLKWIIYSRISDSLQWSKAGEFCPGLDQYFKHIQGVKSNKFVDMVFAAPVLSTGKMNENGMVNEFQRQFAGEMNSNHEEQILIDDETMPETYYLGTVTMQERKMRKKRSKLRIKSEVMTPAVYVDASELPENDAEEDKKPVIKQLTKISSTGEKRLVTYVMDGKQCDEQIKENDGEEKVKCVCGATEENSSEDEEWVECELCHTWQHVDCVAYFPEVQDYFHCDKCLKNTKDNANKKEKKKGRPPKKTIERADRVSESVNGSQSRPVSKPTSENRSSNLDKENLKADQNIANNDSKSVQDIDLSSDGENCFEASRDSDSSYGIAHHGNHINCPCGASDSESGEEWVQCDECDKWQHQLCVNYADEDKTHYQCPSCKQILTFFANKKFAPIAADSLAAKKENPPLSQSKYRIPKLSSKDKDDGFKVVGSSCCNLSSSLSQYQPVYLPKSIDKDICIGILKSTVSQSKDGSNAPSHLNSSTNVINHSSQSTDASLRRMGEIDFTNGLDLLTEVMSNDTMNIRPSISFAIVLCTNCLLVLRGYPASSYQISSKFEIEDREMYMMSVWSNSESTEHQVAMVDYNTDEVLIWKLTFSNDKSQHYSESVSSLPTLVLTNETVVSVGEDTIDRIMWLSVTQLLIYSMNSVCCYDVISLQACWCININLNFVVDWFLQADKKLIIFDNQGSNIVINTDNGDVIQQNMVDPEGDLVVNVKISPSNLLKYEVRVQSLPSLQYATPCKLCVSSNKLFSQQSNPQELLTREHKFLEFNKEQSKDLTNSNHNEIPDNSVCPICKCADLSLSDPPFGVTCSNKHSLFMDPSNSAILDPFSAIECQTCSCYNAESSIKCGACKQRFEC